jgi:hypothetical protein
VLGGAWAGASAAFEPLGKLRVKTCVASAGEHLTDEKSWHVKVLHVGETHRGYGRLQIIYFRLEDKGRG